MRLVLKECFIDLVFCHFHEICFKRGLWISEKSQCMCDNFKVRNISFLCIWRSKMGWVVQGTYHLHPPYSPCCSLNRRECLRFIIKSKYWLCGLVKENLICKWPLESLLFLKSEEHVSTKHLTVGSFFLISKRKSHSNALNLTWRRHVNNSFSIPLFRTPFNHLISHVVITQ